MTALLSALSDQGVSIMQAFCIFATHTLSNYLSMSLLYLKFDNQDCALFFKGRKDHLSM